MAQSSANRATAFNMSSLGPALPHVGYAPTYGLGGQPTFSPAPGATMATQMQHAPQYAVQLPTQAFYPQQAPAVQPYYSMPVYQTHPVVGSTHPRPSIVFHQAQVAASPHHQAGQMQPTVYYYPAATPYPAPSHSVSHPPRQYPAYPTTPIDSRMVPPPIAAGSGPQVLTTARQEVLPQERHMGGEPEMVDGRQAVVRGPPRKPKQRGLIPNNLIASNVYSRVELIVRCEELRPCYLDR